jgi:hypothetical protein
MCDNRSWVAVMSCCQDFVGSARLLREKTPSQSLIAALIKGEESYIENKDLEYPCLHLRHCRLNNDMTFLRPSCSHEQRIFVFILFVFSFQKKGQENLRQQTGD